MAKNVRMDGEFIGDCLWYGLSMLPPLKRADVHMEKLMIQVIRYRIAGVDGRKKRELVGR